MRVVLRWAHTMHRVLLCHDFCAWVGCAQFIAGETVEYRWEGEDGLSTRLDTQKRASIRVLPPHLIIHLKRFEFNYTTFQQVKLNTRFEFPRDLNMKA